MIGDVLRRFLLSSCFLNSSSPSCLVLTSAPLGEPWLQLGFLFWGDKVN